LKDKKKKKKIAFVGGNDSLNRRAIETLEIDYLISPERETMKDTLKQRDSGINHVVARKAKEKDIKIIVDLGEVSKLEGIEKAKRLGKIIQNVKICRKVGCNILLASLASKKNDVLDTKGRQALGENLGMSSQQVKDCVKFV